MSNQFEIQQSYIQRPQSPEVENIMGKLIHDELEVLLSCGYLYQNRSIDLTEIVRQADDRFSAEELEEEFTYRPWTAYSKNRGFTHPERSFTNMQPTDRLGGPLREM